MKAQILKIAGVKSEKEFYKKFPTICSSLKVPVNLIFGFSKKYKLKPTKYSNKLAMHIM